LLTVIIAVLVYKSIVTIGNQPIFKKEYDEKTSSYSSLKIKPDPSGSLSPAKLNSPNVILIRLKDHTILMQKDSEEKIYPASLTKMMTAIVAIENLREIFTSSRHSTQPTNKHPGGITFYSTMFEDLNNQNIIDGEILGGKTGYTDEAGLCLASLAKVGKQEYILISAGTKGDHHSEQYNITDALYVYESIGK